jgi:transcription antitermination factor NusG
MADNQKRWYALYTKPRWEKKVYKGLSQKGIESYCPLNKVKRKWSDRIKTIEEPLFKSYVFVKVAELEKTDVRFVDGVLNATGRVLRVLSKNIVEVRIESLGFMLTAKIDKKTLSKTTP